MIFSRIIINDKDLIPILQKLGVTKKAEFEFYDLIYQNKNGTSITEDTLKVRVYQKNEWNSKSVLVIQKTAPVINGTKEDKVLLREQFDTVDEALAFINQKLIDQYNFLFKLEKSGIQYSNDNLDVWVEDIKGIGISIEFGSNDEKIIEDAITLFDVKERLNESIPEYMYKKLYK